MFAAATEHYFFLGRSSAWGDFRPRFRTARIRASLERRLPNLTYSPVFGYTRHAIGFQKKGRFTTEVRTEGPIQGRRQLRGTIE